MNAYRSHFYKQLTEHTSVGVVRNGTDGEYIAMKVQKYGDEEQLLDSKSYQTLGGAVNWCVKHS